MLEPSQVILRGPTTGELPDLTLLAYRVKAHWGFPSEWLELWADELIYIEAKRATEHHQLAVRDGEILGVISLSGSEDEEQGVQEGEIEGLWVQPEAMAQGLGRKLLKWATLIAGGRGIERLRIHFAPRPWTSTSAWEPRSQGASPSAPRAGP